MNKVSILTPYFNAETTLAATIESVLDQDYQDWELILFNDHSTDGSKSIASSFAQLHPRIKLFDNETQMRGPSHGRNCCFSKSKGDLIAFLDADDLWEKTYLSGRVSVMDSLPKIGMVYGPAIYHYTNRSHIQDTGKKTDSLFETGQLIEFFIKNTKSTPCTGATMVRRSAFLSVGGFQNDILRGEDIAFYIILNSMFPIYYDHRAIFYYVKHENSATSRANKDNSRLNLELHYFKWLLNFSIEQKDKSIIRAAEERYYGHLLEMIRNENFLAGRIRLFNLLLESNIGFGEKIFFFLDCMFPILLAKKIKFRIKKMIYTV